jgi:ABC-type sugar transport system ATPase subunit
MPAPVLELRGVRKSFGGVRALRGVDFDVLPGEVHALLGENGAGKSTLMAVAAGALAPDAGEVTVS